MRKALIAGVSVAVLATGCGGGLENMDTPGRTLPVAGRGPALVAEGGTVEGRGLVDGQGRALYVFDRDGRNRSECRGDCQAAWPPYLTDGEPQAGEGAEAGMIGTIRRPDGRQQVTYAGYPLYRFYKDFTPGSADGHSLSNHGGEWSLLAASGEKVPG